MAFAATLIRPNVASSSVWRERKDISQDVIPDHVDPVLLARSLEDYKRHLFDLYADTWLEDTKWYSSISSITQHPNYTQIVRMGLPALKFMLARMQRGDVRVHWFPAMKDITGGIDPVPAEERGAVSEMARRWIEWGEVRGYV